MSIKNKKLGRPTKKTEEKRIKLDVRLPYNTIALLEHIARDEGVTMTQLCERMAHREIIKYTTELKI